MSLDYELERIYQQYHPGSDTAGFIDSSLDLLDSLKFIEVKPYKGNRSTGERQRESLLRTLRNLNGTLVDHIDNRLWNLFGPPEQGKPTPLSQIILALDSAIPPDEERLITQKASDVPYHLSAVRLLWHTGFWELPYPEGYMDLVAVLRPHADSVGADSTMKKRGEEQASKILEAAISARNANSNEVLDSKK